MIDRDFWWQHVHSGSEAIEAARALLHEPRRVIHGGAWVDVLLVCSELIFRVTGERLTPQADLYWSEQDGKPFIQGPMDGAEIFLDDESTAAAVRHIAAAYKSSSSPTFCDMQNIG